ncbi:MAG: hypothetical protein WC260_04075 [Candidatus Pacearchaeota archaeon]
MLWETILGSLTGLVGNLITSITNYKTQKLKNEHDQKLYEFKIKELGAKTDAAIKITEAKISGEVELADTEAFTKSQEYGNQKIFSDSALDRLFNVEGKMRYISLPVAVFLSILFGFTDFLKGLMRPGLTIYLMCCTTWITWMSWEIMQKYGISLSSVQAVTIFNDVTSIVVYLTVSCVTWWFGDRRIAKFITKMNDKDRIVNIEGGKGSLRK